MFTLLVIAGLAVSAVHSSALPRHENRHDHSEPSKTSLPGLWFHPEDHPVYKLFRRDDPTDGYDYPEVGSPTWYSAYPTSTPDPSQYPQAWVDGLNAAVSAGAIPNIPVSSQSAPGTNPFYPTGYDPTSAAVCSGTYKCRIPGDTWDAPNGYFGTGFDDGPLPYSAALYDFLGQNNETATHFMIGINILNNPTEFIQAYETLGHDIGLHTWTHPYMTTLTNSELLGQFGWAMELIHNSTGGRLPRFWRPPYGDTDVRVRAVAKEVFGLDTILWNQDTEDWSLENVGGTTPAAVNASLQGWLTGPKTPGLIILEHELSNLSVDAFIEAYPVIKANGWNMLSVTQIVGNGTVYQNSIDAFSPVTPEGILAGGNSSIVITATASSTVAPASSSSFATKTASPSDTPSKSGSSPSKNTSSLLTVLLLAAISALLCIEML